jgi:putative hydrolase of HD superfamily
VLELDKLKQVFRQSYLLDQMRRENDAEHSWHLAMMALLLAEYAAEPVDVCRVVKMLLLHDVVEIEAGDTFLYDADAAKDKAKREQQAADHLFGMLPADQAEDFRAAWDEFESRETAEAHFAAALDRLQPLLLHYATSGKTWQEHGVTRDKVMARNQHIADGSPALWELAEQIIQRAVDEGYLRDPHE